MESMVPVYSMRKVCTYPVPGGFVCLPQSAHVRRALLRFSGEMGYVKHDISKAIKSVLNSASGGFREQAADLKRVSRLKS